jgi:zinc transporter ZupT
LADAENEVDNHPEETAELKKDDFEPDAETGNADTHAHTHARDTIPAAPHCMGCSENPGAELEEWQRRAREEEEEAHRFADDGATAEESASATDAAPATGKASAAETSEGKGSEAASEMEQRKPISIYCNKNKPTLVDEENPEKLAESVEVVNSSTKEAADDLSDVSENQQGNADRHENKKLIKMGINTAIAIGIHNFPEGLATFVAALGDVRVGAVLAVAIGVHNVPEGLCVVMPIYYATGNRWKAFGWAVLSGVSEPIAALLGWLVLANVFNDFTYAILFGLVSGMMVVISVKELLPTAHRYDDSDGVVTYSFIVGMMVMALSLVLFYV